MFMPDIIFDRTIVDTRGEFGAILYENLVLPLWQDVAKSKVLEIFSSLNINVHDRTQLPMTLKPNDMVS